MIFSNNNLKKSVAMATCALALAWGALGTAYADSVTDQAEQPQGKIGIGANGVNSNRVAIITNK